MSRIRGGASRAESRRDNDDEDKKDNDVIKKSVMEKNLTDDNENDIPEPQLQKQPSSPQQQHSADFAELQAYRMKQQVLLQLRSSMLSEALVKRGLPLPSFNDVMTPEGATPPKRVDWDCILSTKEKRITCMYTFDDSPGSKLIAPSNSNGEPAEGDWITVAVLNRLRRHDVSKVESMWHNKYAILDSWFRPDSEYSLLQHVGPKGIALNILLNDTVLTLVVALGLMGLTIVFLPLLEMIVGRILVSQYVWMRWFSWARFVHMGLPIKLVFVQYVLDYLKKFFQAVRAKIKDGLVQWECEILDASLPLTLGVPTPMHVEEGDAEILEEEEEIIDNMLNKQEDDAGIDDAADGSDEPE